MLRGSSLAGFGALTPYSDPYFVGDAALFAEYSLSLYKEDWLSYLEKETDQKVALSKSGLLQIATTANYMEKERKRFNSDCIPGYRPEYLNPSELSQREPSITIDNYGAIYHPEPWIDLSTYMGTLTQALLENRRLIRAKMQNRAISVQSTDESVIVHTLDGEQIKSKYLVVATGLSHDKTSGLESFPISWVRGDGISLRTIDNSPIFKNNIYCPIFDSSDSYISGFISPRKNGEMLLGSTYYDEGQRDGADAYGDRESISFGALTEIIRGTYPISTRLQNCSIEREWHGWRPCSIDEYPILGPSNSEHRIIYALAFLGLGITMSVGVAAEITKYVQEKEYDFPEQISAKRFNNDQEDKNA